MSGKISEYYNLGEWGSTPLAKFCKDLQACGVNATVSSDEERLNFTKDGANFKVVKEKRSSLAVVYRNAEIMFYTDWARLTNSDAFGRVAIKWRDCRVVTMRWNNHEVRGYRDE